VHVSKTGVLNVHRQCTKWGGEEREREREREMLRAKFYTKVLEKAYCIVVIL